MELIHGGLQDDVLLTFRLWREQHGQGNIRPIKKRRISGVEGVGQMTETTCMKSLGDLTIHVTYSGRIPETPSFHPCGWLY